MMYALCCILHRCPMLFMVNHRMAGHPYWVCKKGIDCKYVENRKVPLCD